jgi:hypothetical protein
LLISTIIVLFLFGTIIKFVEIYHTSEVATFALIKPLLWNQIPTVTKLQKEQLYITDGSYGNILFIPIQNLKRIVTLCKYPQLVENIECFVIIPFHFSYV